MSLLAFPLPLYALAGAGAACATLGALPVWRWWCRRVGLVDDPGARKIHAEPIPLAGGLAVFTGLAAALLVAALAVTAQWPDPALLRPLGHGLERRGAQMVALLAGALGMLALGWLDDRHELRPAAKLAGQVLVAAGVAACGVRITLFVPNTAFSFAITILWILTVTNAFNFMDNMNGLCAGLGAIAAACFAMKAAAAGQYLVALLAWAVAGATAGFLPYNFPRATAFLGDAGSHLVGYLMAVLAILPHFYRADNPAALAVLNPLLILAVPLGDLAWVVAFRWSQGKPVYVGDTNHLSHRLVRRGCSQARAVLFLWLLAAAAGALAFL